MIPDRAPKGKHGRSLGMVRPASRSTPVPSRGGLTATRSSERAGPRARAGGLAPAPDERRPVAVVDLGSNSGRVVVFRMAPPGHLEILADGRSPLRLAKDLGERAGLSEEAIDRTVAALADFRAIAAGSSAHDLLAVATAAVRDADNGDRLVERVRLETGMDVRVVAGEEEARYSFIGAVHGVAADHGTLMDVGGGSIELTSFRDRAYERSWTLQLGSLRREIL